MCVISVLAEVAVDNHDNEIATDMKYKRCWENRWIISTNQGKDIKIIRPIFGKLISHLLVEVKRLRGHILNYLQGTIFKNTAVIWYLWSPYVLIKTCAPCLGKLRALHAACTEI